VRWLKEEGDVVRKGEPLFELDNDKYVVEIQAFADGVLAEVVVPAGGVVEPGQVVARLDGAGRGSEPSLPAQHPTGERPSPPQAVDGLPAGRPRERVVASPKARRLARELGVDLASMVGSGAGGLVSAADVEAAAAATVGGSGGPDVEPLPQTRRAIGSRMVASKRDAPHFYAMVDADMEECIRLRRHCAEELGWDRPPSFTDLIVAAAARGLRRCPEVNVRLERGGLRRLSSTGIGIAVGLDDGLVVPVIADPDRLGLQELSACAREAADRARNGRLLEDDLADRSLVVSNLGMYGVDVFLAIVDLPDPMILAAGRVAQRCAVVEGNPTVRWQCALALSADHRVLDGLLAARFLGAVQDELGHPFRFLSGVA
jgi:pyruvate dehydrogenase E2 component (dihydrolipoamide acetyltransferase)